jgi:hypothetical protein
MKPRLLLHICCAPDEAWVVHSLKNEYDLHCFFCNPNISPQEEYAKRLSEASRVAAQYGVSFTEDNYAPDTWETAIAPFAHTPEGAQRCRSCFRLRLRATAQVCTSLGIPAFTTVMSVSPHKRITMLNEEGCAAAAAFGVVYECLDFKKKGGFTKSIELSRRLGLYRQDYCGCRLSRAERDARKQRQALTDATEPVDKMTQVS